MRLGVTVHNLLALGHPSLAGKANEGRRHRIAAVTEGLADLGPPRSVAETVGRHTLLARLPDIGHTSHLVQQWWGQQRFVGRTPPARVLALPSLRRVKHTFVRRGWVKEVGVAPYARAAWLALHRASPLAEALDPLRLDPPWAWERVLPILRFAPIFRLVAGRVLEIGVAPTGGAMVSALFRLASLREPNTGAAAPPGHLAFAIGFLAHVLWLDGLFGRASTPLAAPELEAVVLAASEIRPGLVWPPDVDATTGAGRFFADRLAQMRRELLLTAPARYVAARALCRRAVPDMSG